MPTDPHLRLLKARPFHAVTQTRDGLPIETRRRRGRPRKVALAPSQTEYQAVAVARLDELIERDDVVRATARGEAPAAVMSKILEAVAEEAAALAFDRQRAAREGRDIAELAGRRVRALGRLADLALLRHQLDGGQLDLDGPMMMQTEEMWISMVREVAAETVGDPEAFVGMVREAMTGWRERLRPPAPGQR